MGKLSSNSTLGPFTWRIRAWSFSSSSIGQHRRALRAWEVFPCAPLAPGSKGAHWSNALESPKIVSDLLHLATVGHIVQAFPWHRNSSRSCFWATRVRRSWLLTFSNCIAHCDPLSNNHGWLALVTIAVPPSLVVGHFVYIPRFHRFHRSNHRDSPPGQRPTRSATPADPRAPGRSRPWVT